MKTPVSRPVPWIWPCLIALMAMQVLGGFVFEHLGMNLSVIASMLLGLAALCVRPALLRRGTVWALWVLLVPLVLGGIALAATALFHASPSAVWPWVLIALGGVMAIAAFEVGPVMGFLVGVMTVRDPALLKQGRFRRPPLRGLALLAVMPVLILVTGQWSGRPSSFAAVALRGDLPACRQLARRNARLAHATFEGKPILMLAVRADDPETVELFLKHGADPRAQSERFSRATALHWACLDAGVKDNQRLSDGGVQPPRGATPLKTAPKLVRLLLDAGADPNALDDSRLTPLAWAAGQGFQALVEQLVQGGARLNAMPNWMGPRILRNAVAVDAPKSVSWLLDQGVTPLGLPAGKEHDGVEPPLFHVQSPAMVRLLVARGADLKEQNRFGETPLHGLLRNGVSPKLVEAMVELGAPMDTPDHKGITAAQTMAEWKLKRREAELTFPRRVPSQEMKPHD